jgi:hypothetical protein
LTLCRLNNFDLTAVVASGHRWSPYERAVILSKALSRYLELVWADQTPEEPFPEALRILVAEVALETLPHKALDGVDPERVAKRILERLPHIRGDPDARVGRTTSYTWFCGYLMGFVVDGWHHIITAVVWGAGNVKQALLFRPAMQRHRHRVPGKPKGVAADSAFDHPDVHAYLDQEGIEGHITSRDHSKPRDGGFGTDCLVWHPTKGELYCPHSTPLQP